MTEAMDFTAGAMITHTREKTQSTYFMIRKSIMSTRENGLLKGPEMTT